MTVSDAVFRQTLASFFAPIRPLLTDDAVSEVLVNRYDEIYVERNGLLERTTCSFSSEYGLMSALRNLSQYVGRDLSRNAPILEARLPDGSRVEAVIPPASVGGATLTVRRFGKALPTLHWLVECGTMSTRTADLLRAMIRARKNVVVGGGSGSGKTSLLNVLASLADPVERIIVLEDSTELRIAAPHMVRFEAQPSDEQGRNEVTIRQLLRATMRMRPDRIVIGEIRGAEALDLIQAMTSGHRGCLSSVHGTLPTDTLNRIETMALMSDVELPVPVLRAQIASAIDVIVQVARGGDGTRRVTHVEEIRGFDPQHGYRTSSLLRSQGDP